MARSGLAWAHVHSLVLCTQNSAEQKEARREVGHLVGLLGGATHWRLMEPRVLAALA